MDLEYHATNVKAAGSNPAGGSIQEGTMPQLIKYLDEFFAVKQKDLYILTVDRTRKNELSEDSMVQEQLSWLSDRDAAIHMVSPYSSTFDCGWYGWYYIDHSDIESLMLEYSTQYENASGKSLYPDKCQMCVHPYSQWLEHSKTDYDQYLVNREDPDWCPF